MRRGRLAKLGSPIRQLDLTVATAAPIFNLKVE
jgi:hypothetical protein